MAATFLNYWRARSQERLAAIGGEVGSTLTQQAANQCHSNRSMPIMFFLALNDPLIAWGSSGAGTASGELSELADMVGVSKIGGVESAPTSIWRATAGSRSY